MCGYGFGLFNPFGWGLCGIFFFLFMAVVIYSLIRNAGGHSWRMPGYDTPLNILKKRYARGEISREEFEKIKKDI